MKPLDTTSHLYAPAQAEALAAQFQAGDEGWTYRVIHDHAGTGYSYIVVYDEAGEFVSKV